MQHLNSLIDGYHKFYQDYFLSDNPLYKQLKIGQHPKTLIVACSDSRVDPGMITNAEPGDIFSIRNVANLIPPYNVNARTLHGVSSAIEFAVRVLEIPNIIVLGHSHCAGIKAMINPEAVEQTDFIEGWVNIASAVKQKTAKYCDPDTHPQEFCHHCEKEAILLSLDNLMGFPWIKSRVQENKLQIHGWYFSIDNGELQAYNKQTEKFEAFKKQA